MVKYTIFVRGILHEDETPLYQSQSQFTIKCNSLTEEEDSIDFLKDNTSIFFHENGYRKFIFTGFI